MNSNYNFNYKTLLSTFFFSQSVNCLDDIPVNMSFVKHEPKQFYGKLAGQIINRDEQCRRIHGENFYACPQILVSNTNLAMELIRNYVVDAVNLAIPSTTKRYGHFS